MEKPKQKLLAYVGVSLFSGILLGMGFMSLGSLNNQDSVSTNILSVSPTQMSAAAMPSKVISYSGVVNKIGNNSFSVYSAKGDVYNITFNDKTTFSQIVGASSGPYSPATSSALKVNYYAFASGTSDSSPFVANSVIFKAFDSAPYPLVLKATPTTPGTTPAPTTPGTTPAPTNQGTTSAPTSGSTSQTMTSAPTSGSTSQTMTSAPTSQTTTSAPTSDSTSQTMTSAPTSQTTNSVSSTQALPTSSTATKTTP